MESQTFLELLIIPNSAPPNRALTWCRPGPYDVHTTLRMLYELAPVRVGRVPRIDRAAIVVLRAAGQVRVEAAVALLVAAGIGKR